MSAERHRHDGLDREEDVGRRGVRPSVPTTNPSFRRGPYPEACRAILNRAAHGEARDEISSWPRYRPTPLRPLPALAGELELGALFLKEEGRRFGLGSFKALGGPYGVYRILAAEVARRTGRRPSSRALLEAAGREPVADLTMTCASTGNHGRSVAWGCELFGCRCVIFVPERVSEGRAAAISAHGARVERVAGGYERSLREARSAAERRGWHVISDKSGPEGTDAVARDIMQGYTVLVAEALEQASSSGPVGASTAPGAIPFTHVFVQAGVGGLAAAVIAHLWEGAGAAVPRVVVVEAEGADCLRRSARAGRPVRIEGPIDTLMGGLACAEPSPLAWEVVVRGAWAFQPVSDRASVEAMRALSSPEGDPPVAVGESGAAGVAALLAAARRPPARRRLGLGPEARVLAIATEGATDPAVYERLVGRPPPA